MKNVLITGTSSGIGKAIAQHLAQNGFQVIGTSRKGTSNTDQFRTLKLDVTDDNSVANLVKEATEIFGKIDVLINNAGISIAGPIEDITMANAIKQMDTNYFGVVRMTKAVLPQMRERNEGMIINTCSMGGLIGMPFQAHYSASKYAIEGFTESLRYELSSFNIRVTNINPGDFKSEITQNRIFEQNITPAYQAVYDQMMQTYENEENNGAAPIIIAKLVRKLIHQKGNPKIRYVVGKTDQKFFIAMKSFVGSRFFEKVAKSVWKI